MTAAPTRLPLDAERLAAAAGGAWAVQLLPEAGSTNAVAATRPRAGLVVVADHQTAGRGRLDRRWETPPGAALTFSAVVDPALVPSRWPLVPLAAGYAVATCVDGRVKWPNDVLLEDRKVCGVLVERVTGPAATALAVIGIGVNVDQSAQELPVTGATSLRLAGRLIDRTELFGQVLAALRLTLGRVVADPSRFLGDYRAACSTLGMRVRVDLPAAGRLTGTAVDVDEDGRLLVDGPDGIVAVGAGDVLHVRPDS